MPDELEKETKANRIVPDGQEGLLVFPGTPGRPSEPNLDLIYATFLNGHTKPLFSEKRANYNSR